jgi:hypothetical protein
MENIFLSEKCTRNSKSNVYEHFSEKEGRENAETNQQNLVCGEEVHVESRTSDNTSH